jgi:hypothetical protein
MGKPLIVIFLLSIAIIASLYSVFENQKMIDDAVFDRTQMPTDLTEGLYLMAKSLPRGGKVFYWTKDRGIVLECKIASLNYHFYPLNFIFRDEDRMDECGFIICKSSEIAQLEGIIRKKSDIFIFDRTVADYTIFKKLIIER